MNMVKNALKKAIWVSVGITLGKTINQISMSTKLYSETNPLLFKQIIFNFLVVYSASFLTFVIIDWLKQIVQGVENRE